MGQHDHLYQTRSWKARRAQQLRRQPLCELCAKFGRVVLATVADHVEPHRGDPEKFEGALQSLCKSCHDSDKARRERGKEPRPRYGVDGYPLEAGET